MGWQPVRDDHAVKGLVAGGGDGSELGPVQLPHRVSRKAINERHGRRHFIGGDVLPTECQYVLLRRLGSSRSLMG